ncbi:hypothetical protein [Legionella moravica]|uniref:Uncharacterized protein n=1 Tax=Legionella moravica TaxID=39962 RepID=A0A378K192_9GAMM|nr:hypothetical protein [Legionella moravica]STX63378.1 Uncharacterised protein [Legionella moravica]
MSLPVKPQVDDYFDLKKNYDILILHCKYEALDDFRADLCTPKNETYEL